MSTNGDQLVSEWLRGLERNDQSAANHLWQHFFDRVVNHAQARLRGQSLRSSEAEDVAASVFRSLWRGAMAGRFKNVKNRDALWWLLIALTQQKVINRARHSKRIKYGGRVLHVELSEIPAPQLEADSPSPEYLVILQDEYERLLALLRDDQLRQIAVMRMDGYLNEEIASLLGISIVSVGRKLKLIRATWTSEFTR